MACHLYAIANGALIFLLYRKYQISAGATMVVRFDGGYRRC